MTLIECIVNENIFIDFEKEIVYGSDQQFVNYPNPLYICTLSKCISHPPQPRQTLVLLHQYVYSWTPSSR